MRHFVLTTLTGAALLFAPAQAQTADAAPLPDSDLSLPSCPDVRMPIIREGRINAPVVGAEHTVEVGDPILVNSGASVLQSHMRIVREVELAGQRNGTSFVVTVPAGTLIEADLMSISHPGSILSYLLNNATVRKLDKDGQPGKPSRANLWVYVDVDGTTLRGDLKVGSYVELALSNAPIERSFCLSPHQRGLRREMIYGGSVRGTVTLQYREFLDGVARPAFAQEGTFDLSAGNDIAFKGVHLKVVSAGNAGLRYVISAGFPRE